MKECKGVQDKCYRLVLLALLVLLVLPSNSQAQSKKQLENDKAKVEQEIKKLNKKILKPQ